MSLATPTTKLPFYNPLDPIKPKIWPDYTLIMPICAVGNIGQLACDLIISTLLSKQECQLIGRLYSPAIMSVVGPNAFSPKGPPSSSTEVYESKKHKLVIIQQRTTYFKQLRNIYIDELVGWITASRFDNVLVLTSSFAQCNPDTTQLGELAASSIRSITTSQFEINERWRSLDIKPLPDKRTIKVVQDGLTFLPGSGITKPLIKACEKSFIRAAFLVDFCSEGINIQDCFEVVNIIDKFLDLSCSDRHTQGAAGDSKSAFDGESESRLGWVEPFSWTQAVMDEN